MGMSLYLHEIIEAAKRLYLRRHKPKEIADIINVPLRTVYDWRNKGQWDDLLSYETVEDAMAHRLALLAEKEDKQPIDLEEIKSLIDSLVRLRAGRNRDDGESRQNGTGEKRNQGKKKSNTRKYKNDVPGSTLILNLKAIPLFCTQRTARRNCIFCPTILSPPSPTTVMFTWTNFSGYRDLTNFTKSRQAWPHIKNGAKLCFQRLPQ